MGCEHVEKRPRGPEDRGRHRLGRSGVHRSQRCCDYGPVGMVAAGAGERGPAVVWHKKRGVPNTQAEGWYVTMSGEDFLRLIGDEE